MFVKILSDKENKKIQNDYEPLYREESVIWASEGTVDIEPGIVIGECKRSLFYKFMGIPRSEKMPVRVRNICDAGIMYEDSIISGFKKAGLYIDEQIRMEYISENTNHKIITSGKMDLMIKENNKIIGIEIKSISSYKVDTVFGNEKNIPLPAAKNLIQAMHYKRRSLQGPVLCSDGEERTVDEVYLLYVDRSTGSTMYFKVDMDAEGYAIITPIDESGKVYDTIILQDVDSFETLLHHSSVATKEQARLAELRFSLDDVITKFDNVYDYVREKSLPPKTFSLIYNDAEVDREFQCGRISKIKYNKHYKKHEPIGDMMCSFCNYKDKCLKDDNLL